MLVDQIVWLTRQIVKRFLRCKSRHSAAPLVQAVRSLCPVSGVEPYLELCVLSKQIQGPNREPEFAGVSELPYAGAQGYEFFPGNLQKGHTFRCLLCRGRDAQYSDLLVKVGSRLRLMYETMLEATIQHAFTQRMPLYSRLEFSHSDQGFQHDSTVNSHMWRHCSSIRTPLRLSKMKLLVMLKLRTCRVVEPVGLAAAQSNTHVASLLTHYSSCSLLTFVAFFMIASRT